MDSNTHAMTRCAYIATFTIHSRKAHAIQIMKMCQGMAQEGLGPTLILPGMTTSGFSEVTFDDIAGMYGLRHPFPVLKIGGKTALQRLLFEVRSIQYVRSHKIDFIYTRDARVAALSSVFGIPTYLEVHHVPEGRVGPWYFRIAIRGPGLKKLIAITNGLYGLLERGYPVIRKKRNVIIAPDGVDLERYEQLPDASEAARKLGVDPSVFRIGYTGSLYDGRGTELLIELAKGLANFEFWIVGGSSESVFKWSKETEAKNVRNVRFWGFVPNSELPRLQAACQVLIMPSANRIAPSGNQGDISAVTSPMKMFEYMATGRLIVASDLPVFREVLNDSNAVLCPYEDISKWMSVLRRAGTDEDWRLSLGNQARLDSVKFSWRNRVRKIFEL